jgi:predicted metal-binding protein
MKNKMKVGIIRCQQTEDICGGNTDFKAAKEGRLAFEETGPVEIISFVSCGGCPGKRAIARAKLMVERGAEALAFASCITKGNPIGYPCPHYANMRDAVIKKIGNEMKIIEWTH